MRTDFRLALAHSKLLGMHMQVDQLVPFTKWNAVHSLIHKL